MSRQKWQQALVFGFLGLLIVSYQNCSGEFTSSVESSGGASLSEGMATYEWLDKTVFQDRCVDCHSNQFAFSGYNFESYRGIMEAVVPGSPEDSVLYTRLFKTNTFTITELEIDAIRQWIEAGAPEE